MISLKEAASIATKKYSNDRILNGFEYGNLYIFQMVVKDATVESALNYCVSINKETQECAIFDEWDEAYDNPDKFFRAFDKKITPEYFV